LRRQTVEDGAGPGEAAGDKALVEAKMKPSRLAPTRLSLLGDGELGDGRGCRQSYLLACEFIVGELPFVDKSPIFRREKEVI